MRARWRSLKAWVEAWIALRRLSRETPWRDWFEGDCSHAWGEWEVTRGWESWRGSYRRICSRCGVGEYEDYHARTE